MTVRLGGVLAWVLVLSLCGCAKEAIIRSGELPKLSARSDKWQDDRVRVQLLEGGSVEIRRSFRYVRVYPREELDADVGVFRPPMDARIDDEKLRIVSSNEPTPTVYRLWDVESVHVVQSDPSRSFPVWIGLGLGAFLGSTIGYLEGNKDCPDDGGHGSFCIDRTGAAIFGGFAGAAVGTLVGLPFAIGDKYY